MLVVPRSKPMILKIFTDLEKKQTIKCKRIFHLNKFVD